jgi:aminotransferase EvaB
MGRVTTLVWTCLPEYETQCEGIFETVFRSGRLILGDSVRGFEEQYSATVTGLPAVEPG